jgi:hypothetical protein
LNDLQLDPGRQHVEYAAATTEQHRDLVNLQLIERVFLKRRLCPIRTMDQHAAVTCSGLRL